jgi:hypothetical protein
MRLRQHKVISDSFCFCEWMNWTGVDIRGYVDTRCATGVSALKAARGSSSIGPLESETYSTGPLAEEAY